MHPNIRNVRQKVTEGVRKCDITENQVQLVQTKVSFLEETALE